MSCDLVMVRAQNLTRARIKIWLQAARRFSLKRTLLCSIKMWKFFQRESSHIKSLNELLGIFDEQLSIENSESS